MPDPASYQPSVQPLAPGRDASVTVLLSGLATTALALVGVYLLSTNTDDFNIMGWYANYVLPIGALIVGFVAASGYGIASWRTGQKITRRLLWTVLAFQVVAYFVSQYIEFHSLGLQYNDGTPVGFLTYFDFAARAFSWQQKDGTAGSPLGVWGYAFRLLEIVGFCGGSLAVPLLLRAVPYCESCQSYMKTKEAGLLPASVITPQDQEVRRVGAGVLRHGAAGGLEARRRDDARRSPSGPRPAMSTATAPCSPSMPRRRKRSTSCPHGSPSASSAARSAPADISRR